MMTTEEVQSKMDLTTQIAPVEEPSTNTTAPLPVVDFVKWPKIQRLEKINIIATEKLDGTNAQVLLRDGLPMMVGSRNRWITPGKGTDNFGFANWAYEHEAQLRLLGPGTHYGEWYGCGIGRGYGLLERRWALFNIHRPLPDECKAIGVELVPLLYHRQADLFNGWSILPEVIEHLKVNGSRAVPGYMKPEGVVLTINGERYKIVFDKRAPSPEEGLSEFVFDG